MPLTLNFVIFNGSTSFILPISLVGEKSKSLEFFNKLELNLLSQDIHFHQQHKYLHE
jgi:hypothetical protein